jgi:serine/threonine protein kinase
MFSDGQISKVIPSHLQSECYLLDIQLPQENLRGTTVSFPPGSSKEPELHNGLQFHFCSGLIAGLPQDIACRFLQNMIFSRVRKGERIITQGEQGDDFYVILKGTCILTKEKNDMLFEIDRREQGDILGEMALYGEEMRDAHVYAETDTDLLSMGRGQFEGLSQEYPDLRNFLSEVIAHRLSSSKVPADRKIGKYIITERIANGGSGLIFKGNHVMLNMPVAVKMLKHELAMKQDFLEAFRNEANIVAQLNHPNIIRVYDTEELYRTVFIIMEYLDGVPLKHMLRSMKLSLSKIVDFTLQICSGLEYAHKKGIIHQDINPQNIFILPDGQVKIFDFGLACFRGCVDANFLFPGTLSYISPEQIRGAPVDERTDIYSLGITVYEMIAGRVPFTGDDVGDLINAHLQKNIPDIRPTMHDVPEELYTFLRKATQKEPSARYQNISEIRRELLPLSEQLGVLRTRTASFRKDKVIGMSLVYQGEQELALKRLLEEFNKHVKETGAVLRITKFEDE